MLHRRGKGNTTVAAYCLTKINTDLLGTQLPVDCWDAKETILCLVDTVFQFLQVKIKIFHSAKPNLISRTPTSSAIDIHKKEMWR